MAEALDRTAAQTRTSTRLDWRKKMSNHVAFALLFYTGLQIFVTMKTLKETHASVLPYLALIVLVVAIIPGCRVFEARWSELSDEDAANPALASRFARDRLAIWVAAIGLPFALTAVFKGISALFF